MSRRDRDRSFEKALARNFPSSATGPPCPDPETLAAYHENALAPEELLFWNQHFAGCFRCQELLKHLAATDNQALPALETGKPVTAGPSYTVTAAPRSRFRWASSWRWAVPAGALAGGLLVWVAIRQTQSPNLEMAKNQQAPSLSAETAHASPTPQNLGAPLPEVARKAERGLARERSERLPAADASKTSTPEKKGLAPPQANPQKSVPPPAAAKRRDQDAAGAPSAKERGDFLDREGSERSVVKPRGEESVSSSVARLQQEPQAMSAEVPKGVAESSTITRETTSAQPMQGKAPSSIGGTLTAGSEKLRDFDSRVAFRKASAKTPVMILTPEGRVRWRAGKAGMIERSADGGGSWVAQRSGVAADLLAGSAVSDEVCWIIGRAGTILRTTDGGTHWLKLPSPSSQDLAAVRATGAQQAVIFDVSNRRAYKTTDGGASWTTLPAE